MAIYSLEGKPGSGKTFYAVYHLMRRYFEWDKVLCEFVPRSNVSIVSNIEELRLNHYSLPEMISKAGGVGKFFTVEYQRQLLTRLGRIIYIIDEAGAPDLFPKGLKDDGVVFLFQYHRHLGLDFYLLSASIGNICERIVRLSEYVVKAQSRGKALAGRFRYDRFADGERVGIFWVKKDKRIFGLYRSMNQTENEGVTSALRPMMVALGCLVAVVVGVFVYMTGGLRDGTFLGSKKAIAKSVDSPGPLESPRVRVVEKVSAPSVAPVIPVESVVSKVDVVQGVVLPSPDELKRDWVKVQMWRDVGGGVVIFSDRVHSPDESKLLLAHGLKLGDGLYVKRSLRPERVRARGDADRTPGYGQGARITTVGSVRGSDQEVVKGVEQKKTVGGSGVKEAVGVKGQIEKGSGDVIKPIAPDNRSFRHRIRVYPPASTYGKKPSP